MTKQLFLSLAMIALTIAGVTSATVAYFSDSATISGITFSAGTMDLKIDGDPDPDVQSWTDGFTSPYSFTNLYPGYPTKPEEHAWQVLDIKNEGTVNGIVTLKLNATSWSALGDHLTFTVSSKDSGAGAWTPVTTGTLAQFSGNTYQLGPIAGNAVTNVKIEWSVPTTAGNDIRGQSVTIDAVFGLEQVAL